MGYVDEKMEELEYYLSLLLMVIDKNEFPFFYLIMSKKIKKTEVEALLHTCERLNQTLQLEKQEGLLWYEPIFKEFEVVVPKHLEAKETMEALERQGLYASLMTELKKYA